MKWLHLTDIHFVNERFSTKQLRDSLIKKLKTIDAHLDFILITGDVFYQNETRGDIIPELIQFICSLANTCHVDMKRVYLCQGNHDLSRIDDKRNQAVDDARKQNELTDDLYEELKERGNDSFRSLFRALVKNKKRGNEYRDYSIIEDKKLGLRIVSINSCLLSKDKTDYQKLRVCAPILQEIGSKIKDDEKLNLAIMHHNVNWLHPDDARNFEHWVEDNNIDALFVGHTHQPNVALLNDVNHDIYQFTSGALMLDGYAVPTFFLCEENDGEMTVTLYSHTKTDRWEIDNHNLRKFQNGGKYSIFLPRLKKMIMDPGSETVDDDLSDLSCEELIESLNEKYEQRYGTRRFFSDKTSEYEDFNAWKIVSSLGSLGIPFRVAIRLAISVVEQITSKDYGLDDLPGSSFLKGVIEESILNCHIDYPEISEHDIGIWLNKYSRHYNKLEGFVVVDNGTEEQITFSLLKSSILKEVVVNITENEIYYDKISTNDRETMATEIMNVIKSLGISKIKKKVLFDLITEYVSEPPHPWFVNNNKDDLFNSHRDDADKYLTSLNAEQNSNPALQISAAYHLFAAYLTKYDYYLGCTEVGPISILRNAIRQYGNKNPKPPIRRCMLVQLKEDLKNNGVSFDAFMKLVDTVYRNIVERKTVTSNETVEALREIRSVLTKIEKKERESWNPSGEVFQDVYNAFCCADGFLVREPIQHFEGKAFSFSPYWDEQQKRRYNLGDDILVCMLCDNITTEDICKFLSKTRKKVIQELVLFKSTLNPFNPEERKQIRELLKQNDIFVRCVFIQEPNLLHINTVGWRKELFKVIQASKNSMLS